MQYYLYCHKYYNTADRTLYPQNDVAAGCHTHAVTWCRRLSDSFYVLFFGTPCSRQQLADRSAQPASADTYAIHNQGRMARAPFNVALFHGSLAGSVPVVHPLDAPTNAIIANPLTEHVARATSFLYTSLQPHAGKQTCDK